MECSKCGDDNVRLFDGITGKGFAKVCKDCASIENIPLVKKAFVRDPLEERKESVRELLTRVSGVDVEEKVRQETIRERTMKEQHEKFKKIADENIQKEIKAKSVPTDELVDNFHWVIMRARRFKKMTQKELAEAVREPEVAIKMVERGVISFKTPRIIDKIETCLGLKLKKDQGEVLMKKLGDKAQEELYPGIKRFSREELGIGPKKEISFDPLTTKSVTIGELKEIKQEEDVIIREEKKEEEKEEEKPLDERALTDEEIDDILFGRK